MARGRKYRLPSSRSGGSNWPYWLATLLLLAVIAWIWFHTGKRAPTRPPAPVATTTPVPPSPRNTETPPHRNTAPTPVPPSPRNTETPPHRNTAPTPVPPSPRNTETPPHRNTALAPAPAPVPRTDPPPRRPTETPLSTINHQPSTPRPPNPRPPINSQLSTINSPSPDPPPTTFPRPPQNTFEAQVALARRAISSGSLDGLLGSQTRAALLVFQRSAGLPPTGALDPATRARLVLESGPLTSYAVSSNDLTRLQPIAGTWLGKSQQSALDYETILELVAEKFHAHPGYLRTLNAGVDWSNLVAGVELRVPSAAYPDPAEKAAFLRISLAAKSLAAFGAGSNLLAHFPCSIAQHVEKRPVGELHIAAVAPNPNYTFNPDVFPESSEARALGRKLILPPGPNNPVGVAWISLDRAGYGIHGTPGPEQVGRTESHGCFRLANWNAEYLLKLVTVGTPVFVEQ